MVRFSFPIVFFLSISAFSLHQLADAGGLSCLSCASPIAQSEWQATGLPFHPPIGKEDKATKQFLFLAECENTDTTPDNDKMPMSLCAGGFCLEMLMVINHQYSVVRGCLDDFYPANEPPSSATLGCSYNTVNQNVTFLESSKTIAVKSANIGSHLCSPTTDNNFCNNDLRATKIFAQGTTGTSGWGQLTITKETCQKAPGVRCLNCLRVDMEGTCHWDVRNYCTGAWCTKTIGYVNGRWLEVRGCAASQPMNTQSCVKIERKTDLALLGETQVPRTISLEQCFCNTQLCNGAIRKGLLGAVLIPSLLAISLLTIL